MGAELVMIIIDVHKFLMNCFFSKPSEPSKKRASGFLISAWVPAAIENCLLHTLRENKL
jgi:hypothetical protein